MAGKPTAFANAVLKLIFWGTAIPDIAENDTTSPLTSFYVGLHSADPGEAGNQASSEIVYTGYARLPLERGAAKWNIVNDVVNPIYDIDFAARTDAGSTSATHFSIGSSASGPGVIYYFGAINPAITITQGVTPRIKSTSTITEA